MGIKKFSLRLILVFFVSVMLFEVVLKFKYGLLPFEPDRPLFKFQFEEIYEKFFIKVHISNGTVVYKTQRNRAKDQSFPVHKIKGTRRIFILGGSVAYGMDTEHIKKLLETSIPDEKFELINCGMCSYDSYRESLIQKEILDYEPDFIILLSGNNEYFYPVRVNLFAYRLNQMFRNLYVYRIAQEKFKTWGRNHGILVEINRDWRLANFENNIRTMILMAKKKNIPMVLCTLPANIRDCPPTGFPIWQDKQFLLAWDSLNKRKFEEAMKKFEQFLIAYPEDPFGNYFLAKCYDALGYYHRAQEYYTKAKDLDAEPGDRCLSSRNEVIRRLCSQEAKILVDLDKFFTRMAPHGLPGDELFSDNCHWWSEYYHLIYEELAQAIIAYYKSNLNSSFVFLDRLPSDFVSKRQNFLIKKHEDLRAKAFAKLLYIPEKIYFLIRKNRENSPEKRTPVCKVNFMDERTIVFLQTAYQWCPEMFNDMTSLKKSIFMEILNSRFCPVDVLLKFDEIWLVMLYHIGEAFRRLGEPLKAIKYFDEAINLSGSDVYLPYLGRALVYYEIGEVDKAKKDFEEITKKPCQHPLVEFYRESLGI